MPAPRSSQLQLARRFTTHRPPPRHRRERRARELLTAATDACVPRRSAALANIPTAPAVANVYSWGAGGGGVVPGARVTFAYNCGSGPLAYTNAAKLHLGVDNWRDKKTTVGWGWGSVSV